MLSCFITLSKAATSDKHSPTTLRFLGTLRGKVILILIDSGSSHTSVSQQLASQLVGGTSMAIPIVVQVANGSKLVCDTKLLDCLWSVQGYQFHSNVKVLPLQFYDMIVGMDWLQQFSPMQIDWSKK
jgi:predicted aspartyl protease